MPKKTIASADVQNKKVLVRVDFNVPVENGQIADDTRIRAALPTIKSILDRGGSAILMSHLGRPEGKGFEPDYTLAPVAKRLGELLGKPVAFPSNDCVDDKAAAAVKAMKSGDVVLLDNLRYHKAEKKGDPAFAAKLAAYADVYVNDAFGTCHRPEASMVAVPRAMGSKPKVVGFLVEKEIKYLDGVLANPVKPFVVVLGGAKVSDKMPAIERLLPMASAVIVGGAMAYTFLKAKGVNVGKSRVEEDKLSEAQRAIELATKTGAALHLPTDHICATDFSENTSDIKTFTNETGIDPNYMGLDIGPNTQAAYADILRKAKTVVWNGPMGVFEWPKFATGTRAVAQAIVEATSKNGCTSIVGGGDSAAAVEQFDLASKFSHVSTGGGASLEMLEGKKFESVTVLDEA